MENCVKLEVPSVVDAEFGPNWGEAKQPFTEKLWESILKGKNTKTPT